MRRRGRFSEEWGGFQRREKFSERGAFFGGGEGFRRMGGLFGAGVLLGGRTRSEGQERGGIWHCTFGIRPFRTGGGSEMRRQRGRSGRKQCYAMRCYAGPCNGMLCYAICDAALRPCSCHSEEEDDKKEEYGEQQAMWGSPRAPPAQCSSCESRARGATAP